MTPALPSKIRADRWLLVALAFTVLAYATLAVMKPSGEGFGRGWNLVAFYLYFAPATFMAGGVAAWRRGRVAGAARQAAGWGAAAGLLFPVLALLVLRTRH